MPKKLVCGIWSLKREKIKLCVRYCERIEYEYIINFVRNTTVYNRTWLRARYGAVQRDRVYEKIVPTKKNSFL